MNNKKSKITYICEKCGECYLKWVGKCTSCNEWNTVIEDISEKFNILSLNGTQKGALFPDKNKNEIINLSDVNEEFLTRNSTGFGELDRLLGGGLVEQSAILVSGEPGIGKSTLLLQICNYISQGSLGVLYISAEESLNQIKIRSQRLGITGEKIKILVTTSLLEIMGLIYKGISKSVIIVDSIQTIYLEEIPSSPGSIAQVKASAFELVKIAKQLGHTVIIIGHITKDGQIAGPKLLEHMVDVVLSFEGENMKQHRIVRSIKNRYGSTNDIGIFTMSNKGLNEVTNPSSLFLSNKYEDGVVGSCITACNEGSRSILVEIQALTAHSFFPNPKRVSIGWDTARLGMIIAIINAKLGIKLMEKEVYMNIVGGLRVTETGIDLAVATTLLSSYEKILIPRDTAFIGEIGLLGELRAVAHIEARLNEVSKMGFKKVVIAKENLNCIKDNKELKQRLVIDGFSNLRQLFQKMKSEYGTKTL